MELLKSSVVRPRQVRCQVTLRRGHLPGRSARQVGRSKACNCRLARTIRHSDQPFRGRSKQRAMNAFRSVSKYLNENSKVGKYYRRLLLPEYPRDRQRGTGINPCFTANKTTSALLRRLKDCCMWCL